MFVSAILAAAGRGTRLGSATPKQMLALGDRTILQRSFDIVEAHDRIDEIVIALPPALASAPPPYLISSRKPVRIVDGGMRRQDSVAKAFAQVSKSAEVIVIHDAARPFATRGPVYASDRGRRKRERGNCRRAGPVTPSRKPRRRPACGSSRGRSRANRSIWRRRRRRSAAPCSRLPSSSAAYR